MKFMRDYRIRAATDAARRCNGSQTGAPPMPVRRGGRRRPDRPRQRLPSKARPTFAIELDGRLPAGQSTVMAEILVNSNAMNSEIERIPLAIGKEP